MTRARTLYGTSPLHLLAAIASFAVAGYGFFRIVEAPSALDTVLWFAACVVAHDLIAFPLYSALNLVASSSLGGRGGGREVARRVPAINHLRIPFYLSALAFILFFPEVLALDADNYRRDAGLGVDVFLSRWLGICAVLFVGSALLYALRLRRAARREGDDEGGGDDGDAVTDTRAEEGP